jgi:hypothetical protein
MLTVVTSKWSTSDGVAKFGAVHVNVLRAALAKHLHLPHELVCITDDAAGIDPEVRIVPMPREFAHTPRCRRRMQFYSREFSEQLGARNLYLDLDIVLVDDITPIVNRPEPIVCWKVGHAGVFSGSFVLADAGALDGAWRRFAADPEGYPRRVQASGVASDQAMLNHYLSSRPPIPFWTERDGFVTFYGGPRYERLVHLGVGPGNKLLKMGARIVVLGSDDLDVLTDDSYPFVRKHWTPLAGELAARRSS